MIEEVFPFLVDPAIPLPKSDKVWESSRFCLDRNLPHPVREQAKFELVYAQQKFCLENDIEYMVGVMPPAIWRAVFGKFGWNVEPLGEVKRLDDGSKVLAAKMPVSRSILDTIAAHGNVGNSVPNHININYRKGMVGDTLHG